MKKIPTLFIRRFENNHVADINNEVTPGLEWVLSNDPDEHGIATIKWDGSCTTVMNGEFYKRYDAKNGKIPPEGAIPCQEDPDPITGHFPHWLKCKKQEPSDKWLLEAFNNYKAENNLAAVPDGTYEAVGPHFQGNPYKLEKDILIPHGKDVVEVKRSFDDIKEYLKNHNIEGLVFWKDGIPRCKIKRSDFGYTWK